MHDEQGLPPARFAGHWIGIQHAVTSCLPEDYLTLACKLVESPAARKLWTDEADKYYQQVKDPAGYARRLERIIQDAAPTYVQQF